VRVLAGSFAAQDVQVVRPTFDRILRDGLAVQYRRRVLDDVVDLIDVGLEIADDRLGGVDQSLQRRAQPAD